VQQHLVRLEGLILDGYRSLLHKKSLLSRVVISPETFAVSLYDARERLVPTDRLSAGERQILAVSILWGLARASGRPLPTIIDTPLGRLDSTHRAHLVERYFPCASHQVLLLSTDEEVDENHFKRMQSRIGRTYILEYQEANETTLVRDGYFWD
jgi:DNA sulfur modification protein DndD